MNKMIAGLLACTVAALALWAWVYGDYERTQNDMITMLRAGDGRGALSEANAYASRMSSYPMRTMPYLNVLWQRLQYHQGVASQLMGDDRGAETAFREAAQSTERDIAAKAHYNLAFPALKRNDLEGAKGHLSKALELVSADVETKVNLELLLKKIKAEGSGKGKGKDGDKENKPEQGPTDLWKLDFPDNDGESGEGSKRSYR